MSADRELLELAAKAAAYNVEFKRWSGMKCTGLLSWNGDWTNGERSFVGGAEWNPLTDDGDALRLAAALRLQIRPGKHKGDGCTVETQHSGIAGCTAFYDDEAQQMRRAIVSAAAEIGKAIP